MNIVLVSSAGQCGIYECAQIMLRGFQNAGHQARFIGVQQHDNGDLRQKMRQLNPEDEVIILEYEPGVFWPYGAIQAMFVARYLRRKKIILSVHEFSLDKFAEYLMTQYLWEAEVKFSGVREVVRVLRLASLAARRYIRLRFALLMLTSLPHTIIVHSETTVEHLRIGLHPSRFSKVFTVPLAVEAFLKNRDEARQALGLPSEPFMFIIPGFIFRRKRIIEVIEQLPPDTELWVVGITSEREADYLEEIQAYVENSPKASQVHIIQEYEIKPYIQAADAVVLFYREIFQSAVASQAVGAGKPCIFSDLPGFNPFKSAGITVRSPLELRQAMVKIQEPSCYQQLVKATRLLRERLSPEQVAYRYLEVMSHLE
jgi:glycosyltransferase involved in cell wall biosynthesis